MAIYQVGLAQQITYAWGAELAAEQHRRTGLGMRRAEAAGPSSDRFTPRQPELVVQFAVCSLAVVGAAFVPFFWSADMSADGGAPQPGVLQPGVNEFQQRWWWCCNRPLGRLHKVLDWHNRLRKVSEGVVTEVVQQAQAGDPRSVATSDDGSPGFEPEDWSSAVADSGRSSSRNYSTRSCSTTVAAEPNKPRSTTRVMTSQLSSPILQALPRFLTLEDQDMRWIQP